MAGAGGARHGEQAEKMRNDGAMAGAMTMNRRAHVFEELVGEDYLAVCTIHMYNR